MRATLEGEYEQSQRVRRTFTEIGFAKGRLPNDLFNSISTYYYNNQRHLFREEWRNKGVFVNWWQVQLRQCLNRVGCDFAVSVHCVALYSV